MRCELTRIFDRNFAIRTLFTTRFPRISKRGRKRGGQKVRRVARAMTSLRLSKGRDDVTSILNQTIRIRRACMYGTCVRERSREWFYTRRSMFICMLITKHTILYLVSLYSLESRLNNGIQNGNIGHWSCIDSCFVVVYCSLLQLNAKKQFTATCPV